MAKKDFTKQHSFFTDEPQKKEDAAAGQATETREAPEGFKPAYIEVKSKRVQLVFKPSTYDRAKEKAASQGISLNEYIHRLIEADTQ